MITQSDIAKRAYELWEKSGRQEGRHQEHWLQAETELSRQQKASAPGKSAAAPLLKGRERKVSSR